MDSLTKSPFQTIPFEMIIEVLDTLHFQALVTCRQVCRTFCFLIDNTARLQYTIELAATGMMNGPPSSLSPVNRLERLRKHRDAWDTLTWTQDFFIKMARGHVWELYGGVLAQCRFENTFVFWQLPSTQRGIEARHWSVHIDQSQVRVRDFTIDPSQDLLAIIECPNELSIIGDPTFRTHIRSLSTGEVHPLVSQSAFISFEISSAPLSFGIQISGDYVGVHFLYDPGSGINQLFVWEWKTGQLKLKLVGDEMKSFTFLTDSHVLVATLSPGIGAKLLIVDFKENSDEESLMERCTCALDFPTLNVWADPLHITIRSDPMPSWEPVPEHRIPFYHGKFNQLFVVTMWVHDGRTTQSVVLFVPSSTLQKCIQSANGDKYLTWKMWGPEGSRMLAGLGNSSVWVCYVYGSRFVVSRAVVSSGHSIEVYDFNQLGFRRALQDRESYPRTKFIASTKRIASTSTFDVFGEDVCTTLPYRKQTIYMEHKACGGKIDAVMCSEDSLVVVAENRQFRILTM